MSKSPSILLPALGVTGLVLGVAYGVTTRSYKADEARLAQSQAMAATALAEKRATEAEALRNQVIEIEETSKNEIALLAKSGGSLSEPAPARDVPLGLGRAVLPDELAAWDVDVMPDGRGLPDGRGDVLTGDEIFAEKCAACHGDFAEGVDNWPVLAGGFDTLADKDPVKTVGSYWPLLSTVWDYVHRSMPFGAAQTLSDDEVYAIVAYILYSNDLVDEDFELSNENFNDFQMYNRDGFVIDDRLEAEYANWRAEPCMENCKESVEITMRASVLNVTPEEEGAEPASAAADTPAADDPVVAETNTAAAPALDMALVAAGEKVFKKCKACHAVGDGARNKTGPHLNALFGRIIGSSDGYGYSSGFQAANAEGRIWDEAALAEFLTRPKDYIKGTRMSFAGLKKSEDLAAVTEYLKTFSP